MLRRPSGVCRPVSIHHFQRSSSPKPLGQSKPDFIWTVEPQWDGGTKVCLRCLGHMTKMATTSIYGKNPSEIFFRTKGQWPCGLVCSIGPIIVCSNDDSRLTLTYFMARSILVSYAFICGKLRKSFNGRNLWQITRVTKGLYLCKNSDPKGLSAPAPGL